MSSNCGGKASATTTSAGDTVAPVLLTVMVQSIGVSSDAEAGPVLLAARTTWAWLLRASSDTSSAVKDERKLRHMMVIRCEARSAGWWSDTADGGAAGVRFGPACVVGLRRTSGGGPACGLQCE